MKPALCEQSGDKQRNSPSCSARIAAVVVTYKRAVLVLRAIENILDQARAVNEIIVVDNDNDPGVSGAVRSRSNLVTYCAMETNVGPAGGFSFGISKALERNADFVWCFDDDCYPDDNNCLGKLLDSFSGNTQIGVARPMMRDPSSNKVVGGGVWSGGLIRADAIRTCGLPRDDYFIEYEDSEYLARIMKKFAVHRNESASVVHSFDRRGNLAGRTLRKAASQPPWRMYYSYRNRISYGVSTSSYGEVGKILIYICAKTLRALLFGPSRSLTLSLTAKAICDGLAGRLGISVLPSQ